MMITRCINGTPARPAHLVLPTPQPTLKKTNSYFWAMRHSRGRFISLVGKPPDPFGKGNHRQGKRKTAGAHQGQKPETNQQGIAGGF